MRLLFLSNLFPDTTQPWRGLDNVTLLHAMRAQRPDADIRVICLRPGHGGWMNRPCGLKPRPGDEVFSPLYGWAPYLPKFGGMNDRLFALAVGRMLKALPKGWKPDRLLVPWLFPDASGVARVGALDGIPMVCVAQGSDVHRYLDMPMRRQAILRLAARANIITRSEDLRRRLMRAGADGGFVHTVYNGVDTQVFKPGDKQAARRSLGLPTDGRLLLFVGNFLPVKGLDLLVKATALASEKLQEPLRLVMIGSGPLQQELCDLARQSGLKEDGLIWAGRRNPQEVSDYMRACDAVCLSSHNEGVPNVLLEALASGRPLVTTDVGGIGEILRPSPLGETTLVTGREPEAYANVLCRTLQHLPNEGVLSHFGQGFEWQICAGAYWNLCDDPGRERLKTSRLND
jgi:glycosyltransferase involved in cell wall biosynthesis